MENQTLYGPRATSTDELGTVLSKFFNEANEIRALKSFKPRPTDIIITPYAKCGTTLLQHIAHGLRTRGSMDFDEITAVTPWIELAYDVGWDLEAEQVAKPRIFKSHVSWYDVPKGAKYICSFRHYHAAYLSFYRMFEGWYFEPGSISVEELLKWRWPRAEMGSRGYWYHLSSWWEQRHKENVLLLCYEDMIADLPKTIKILADFMGIELDDELLDIVTRQSSREFMLAHGRQFDAHPVAEACGPRAGLPPPISSAKVTTGTPDEERYRLSAESKQLLDEIWREQITPKFGLETYEDLRQAVKELHKS